MRHPIFACIALAGSLVSLNAGAWEPDSTHAGLTEQSALSANLHDSLSRDHGHALGLFATLQVMPASAEELFVKLRALSPNEGFVPDARGKQTALAWLVAGSVLEGMPAKRNQHHFYDPIHNTGLTNATRAGVGSLPLLPKKRPALDEERFAAFDWVMSDRNELGMVRFLKEMEASVLGADAAKRDHHMAYALLCAGAMLHVLQDMGVPSRVRDDLAAHLQTLGGGWQDRGSRIEHLAALAFGRLGVASADKPVHRKMARDFFSAKDKLGLADLTANGFYSLGTLPTPLDVSKNKKDLAKRLVQTQRFPAPVPVSKDSSVDLQLAAHGDGGVVRNANKVCLANYRIIDGKLTWGIGDACALDQVRVLLPMVSNYSSGFLAWLFRGKLQIRDDGAVVNGQTALGKGTLAFYWDDNKGNRKPLDAVRQIAAANKRADLGKQPAAPTGARRIIAIFRGVDKVGESVIAVGQRTLK